MFLCPKEGLVFLRRFRESPIPESIPHRRSIPLFPEGMNSPREHIYAQQERPRFRVRESQWTVCASWVMGEAAAASAKKGEKEKVSHTRKNLIPRHLPRQRRMFPWNPHSWETPLALCEIPSFLFGEAFNFPGSHLAEIAPEYLLNRAASRKKCKVEISRCFTGASSRSVGGCRESSLRPTRRSAQ